MQEKIAICVAFTDNYFNYAYSLINSFIQNNKWFNQDIVILGDNEINISEDTLNKLKQLYPNIVYKQFFKTDKINQFIERFKPNFTYAHWYYSYLKIYMFNLEEYDKILWLDTDIIINGDISEIFQSNDDINVACDCITQNKFLLYYSQKYFTDKWLAYNNEYCNAGVIYIGNKNFIKRLYNEFLDFCLNYNFEWIQLKNNGITTCDFVDGHAFEQDMLNAFIKRNKNNITCHLLPIKYNTSTSNQIQLINNAKIVHYWCKPIDLYKSQDLIQNTILMKCEIIYNKYALQPVNVKFSNTALIYIVNQDQCENIQNIYKFYNDDINNCDCIIYSLSNDDINKIYQNLDEYENITEQTQINNFIYNYIYDNIKDIYSNIFIINTINLTEDDIFKNYKYLNTGNSNIQYSTIKYFLNNQNEYLTIISHNILRNLQIKYYTIDDVVIL